MSLGSAMCRWGVRGVGGRERSVESETCRWGVRSVGGE